MKALTYGFALLIAVVVMMQFAKGAAEKTGESVEKNLQNRYSEEAILGK